MEVHDFYKVLGASLDALDRATGAEDRVKTAERQLQNKQNEISALADAHAKLKADSDAHLATNLAKLNEETVRHNNEVGEMQRKIRALEEMHKTQQENASNTLTHLNTQIGLARKELDEINIEREKTKNHMLDYARRFSGM